VARPLEILVCIKQVLDTEVSSEVLQIGGEPPRVSAPGVPPVLDPYSLNALKGALDLKAEGGATITVLSVGASPSKGLLLKSLAAGADRLLALRIAPAPEALGDGLRTARQLAALVHRVERFDLVLAGRMGADTSAGTTGPLLAALLDLPLVTMAMRLQRETETQLFVERLASDEIEQLSCPLPAVVTVSSEIGELPPLTVSSILREARSKPFEVLEPAELGLLTDMPLGIELVSLEKPSRERDCRMVSGGDARLRGSRLVEMLRQEGVL
jgi:electron transfer flavoprotein beta subunit